MRRRLGYGLGRCHFGCRRLLDLFGGLALGLGHLFAVAWPRDRVVLVSRLALVSRRLLSTWNGLAGRRRLLELQFVVVLSVVLDVPDLDHSVRATGEDHVDRVPLVYLQTFKELTIPEQEEEEEEEELDGQLTWDMQMERMDWLESVTVSMSAIG